MAISRRAQLLHRAREVAVQLVYMLFSRPNQQLHDTFELFPTEEAFELFEDEQKEEGETTPDLSRFQSVSKFNLEMSEGERNFVMSFAAQIFGGVRDNVDKIDDIIRNNVDIKWRPERIATVEKSIISIAIYEAYIGKDAPLNVTISEAVELSKTFGTEESARFVNGFLGFIARNTSNDSK